MLESSPAIQASPKLESPHNDMVTTHSVFEELKQIFDPEIPVNIVDLGLVYDVMLDGTTCKITMSLTSKLCPEAKSIPEIMKRRVIAMDGIEAVDIEIVWEPEWGPQRISAEGRKILGIEDEPAAEAEADA